MTDIFTKAKRSKIMAAIRPKHNQSTEMALVTILRTTRITGWRRHVKMLGNPDFVFPKQRVILFVDGCFWHGCPWHGHWPHSNRAFWRRKLTRNKARDRRTTKELRIKGWRVLRFWEHQFKTPARVCAKLRAILGKP